MRFFEEFEEAVGGCFDSEPAFTLVLGAGASCSAGIPLADRMVDLLVEKCRQIGCPVPPKPDGESPLSFMLGLVADFDDARRFIVTCIRRGAREPNVAHLVAANLACVNVFRTIVTTNFDDLVLAGFWQLPVSEAYAEPFVVFDPSTVDLAKVHVGEEVPVVVKAHGHHTHYGLGAVDLQIRRLVPHVVRAMRWAPQPRIGFVVVGYSGGWEDGIIHALTDAKLTRGKRVYWFFRGPRPPVDAPGTRRVMETADVRFVRCDDADYLFLKLWYCMRGTRGSDALLLCADLFSPVENRYLAFLARMRAAGPSRVAPGPALPPGSDPWWSPSDGPTESRDRRTRAGLRRDLGVPALRRRLLPLLDEIDRWDDERLVCDILLDRRSAEFLFPEPQAVETMNAAISPRISWTRRNRKLLRLALAPFTDPFLTYELLTTIDDLR